MAKKVPQTFIDDLQVLLVKHRLDALSFEIPDTLGQALVALGRSDTDHLLVGMAYAYCQRHKVAETIVSLIEELYARGHADGKPYVYNDVDCDLMAFKCKHRWKAPVIKDDGEDDEKEAKIYEDDVFGLFFADHSSSTVFIVTKKFGREEIHIRSLPSGLMKREKDEILKLFKINGFYLSIRDDVTGAYKSSSYKNPYLHYGDSRDEGADVSIEYDVPYPDNYQPDRELSHDLCSTNCTQRGMFHLSTVAEHFTCVLEDIRKGEKSML